MIFRRESYEARVRRLMGWHRWFAWRPVRVDQRRIVWLRWVHRRALPISLEDHGGIVWGYLMEEAKP